MKNPSRGYAGTHDAAVLLGERAERQRVVHDEGRLQALRLDQLAHQKVEQLGGRVRLLGVQAGAAADVEDLGYRRWAGR